MSGNARSVCRSSPDINSSSRVQWGAGHPRPQRLRRFHTMLWPLGSVNGAVNLVVTRPRSLQGCCTTACPPDVLTVGPARHLQTHGLGANCFTRRRLVTRPSYHPTLTVPKRAHHRGLPRCPSVPTPRERNIRSW
ncbi:hypothetical protein C8Q77DRAFT_671146 [Trametes polyzona]|nr:hypothetical protein C8Q77DRAFT_671146 [Trametes polyzona]